MKIGDAFTMAVPPRYDTPHLFFVISDPLRHRGQFVVVNLTTDYIRAGGHCVLYAQDHAWITKESFISFRDAMLVDAQKAVAIQGLVGTLVTMQQPLTEATLKKIVELAKTSTSMAIALREML